MSVGEKVSYDTLLKEYFRLAKVDINEFYGNGNTINGYFHHIEDELKNRLTDQEFNKIFWKARKR